MLRTINKFVESDATAPVRIQGIKQLIGPLPVDKEYLREAILNVVINHIV
jgi:hypothetical protein